MNLLTLVIILVLINTYLEEKLNEEKDEKDNKDRDKK